MFFAWRWKVLVANVAVECSGGIWEVCCFGFEVFGFEIYFAELEDVAWVVDR